MTDEATDETTAEAEKIVTMTKRGFDLTARLKNRGLRKATITLFLDEEKGAEIGWAYDITDSLGNFIARARSGIVGDLDAAQSALETLLSNKSGLKGDAREERRLELIDQIKAAEEKRDKLVEELSKTALVVRLRAIPPKLQKDCVRKARATLGITEKGVPEDKVEDVNLATQAHLMSMVIQSITDNESGQTNNEATYDDCIELMEELPPSQFARLDQKIGEVQFTDHISQTIEAQEDFS